MFMLSLLLPNRVDVGIKAVFGTLIDKWEDGEFLDEMDNEVVKPYINVLTAQYIDGVSLRVSGSEDEEILEPAVRGLHLRAGNRSRLGQRGLPAQYLQDAVPPLQEILLREPINPLIFYKTRKLLLK